jgi:sialate O-acetylesterase
MKRKALCLFVIIFCIFQSSFGQVTLPQIIRDCMILQLDTKIKIWGWAAKDEKVVIVFNGRKFNTKTGIDGKWMIRMPSMKAGGPFTMEIVASNQISLKNILIDDVWLCSGQSNMVYQLGYNDARYAKEIVEVNYPQIRQFKMPVRAIVDGPKDEIAGGSWKCANPKNILPFSAMAYFLIWG